MVGEPDSRRWFGIRPTSPAENIPVTATDFDIRDITKVSDSIEVWQSVFGNLKASVKISQVGATVQTARDWSGDFANLDIALSALRDAITTASPNNKTLADLYTALTATTIAVAEQSPLTEIKANLIPGTNNNPSFDIDYDASDRIDQIDMTINGTTYRRTIAYTAGGMIDTISAWVEQ